MKWLWEGGIKRGQKGLASVVHVLSVIKVDTRMSANVDTIIRVLQMKRNYIIYTCLKNEYP